MNISEDNLGKSVMIVDDDAHIRKSVEIILKNAGYNVFVATGGQECIKHIKDGFNGAILLDIMMPEMDGWDTINEIIQNDLYKGIIITMLTAKNEPDEKMLGLQEYVSDYITKPFEMEELINKVECLFQYLPPVN